MLKALALVLAFVSCVHPGPTAQTFRLFEPEAPKDFVVDGHIYFETGVNEDSVRDFVEELEAEEKADGATAVTVHINSPGGSVFAGFKMGQALERSKLKSVCVVDGMAASMGFYILQSCTERTMTDRSLLMGHAPATSTSGMEQEMANTLALLKALNHAMATHITARSNMTLAEYLQKIAGGGELWLTSDEALRWGFVDSIASP